MMIYKDKTYKSLPILAKHLAKGSPVPPDRILKQLYLHGDPDYAVERATYLHNRAIWLNEITWNGKTQNSREWAAEVGIHVTGFVKRLDKFGVCEETFKTKNKIAQEKALKRWKQPRKRGNWDLGEMQPRQDIKDMPKAGKWEAKNLDPQSFTQDSRGHCVGHDSVGTRYRGD